LSRIKKKIRQTILSKSYQPSVDKGFAKELDPNVYVDLTGKFLHKSEVDF
ncbi:hypothetical protein LCGC14_2934230, partial [marine sediment metagenome]